MLFLDDRMGRDGYLIALLVICLLRNGVLGIIQGKWGGSMLGFFVLLRSFFLLQIPLRNPYVFFLFRARVMDATVYGLSTCVSSALA